MNKVLVFVSVLFYCGLLLAPAMIYAQKTSGENKIQSAEKTMAADSAVTVTIDAEGDGVKVRGWERDEVRVNAADQRHLELRRTDKTAAKDSAASLEVITGKGWGEIELSVPRGATVKIKLAQGNVSVEDVAAADITAIFGNIDLRRISKSVSAATPTLGDIFLADSSGAVNLRTQSGTIKLRGVQPAEKDDAVNLNSIAGNFELERVSHPRITAETISGSVSVNGPATKGTIYSFKTVTGNLILNLPRDASFQFFATIGEEGKIFTEFPLEAVKKSDSAGSKRRSAKYGAGDSVFYLATFNGQVRLRVKAEDKKK